MIAEGVRDTDLGAFQRAARLLLVHPLVTRLHPDADALPLVRRFAPALGAAFDAVAGYRFELGTTSARLVRRIERLDPTQQIQPRDRKPFDRRRYAYLCLVLGALGRAGTQVALTELADALRRRAAEVAGLGFDPDEYRHRLAFVDVVVHLESVGVLRPVEVSSVTWLKDPDAGEALYDVDREAAHQLFVPPRAVQHVRSVASLLVEEVSTSRDTRRASSRQRLGRLLLEHPVVYLDDLGDADRAYLLNQARSLADDLGRLTGAVLERRAEGVALIDVTGRFSDRSFPAGGTPAQVALLLAGEIADAVVAGGLTEVLVPSATEQVDDLVNRLDAARPAVVEVPGGEAPDRPLVPSVAPAIDDAGVARCRGPLLTDAWLAATVERLAASYGKAFAADLRDDPQSLLAAATRVLSAFDLVRAVPGGLVARPAIARYRDVKVAADVTTAVIPTSQLSLLDLGADQ